MATVVISDEYPILRNTEHQVYLISDWIKNDWVDEGYNNKLWYGSASSTDGKYLLAGCNNTVTNECLLKSNDYGATFTWHTVNVIFSSCAMSYDGQYQTATIRDTTGRIYRSNNYGSTFASVGSPELNWSDCAVSGDGKYQIATYSNHIYTNDNYGANADWTQRILGPTNWFGCAINGDGQYQTVVKGGELYRSDDYGVSFGAVTGFTTTLVKADISEDGQFWSVAGTGTDSGIYRSDDFGLTFTRTLEVDCSDISITLSGQQQIASSPTTTQLGNTYSGTNDIYWSKNYGKTWELITDVNRDYFTLTLSEETILTGVVGGNIYTK